MIGLFDSGIGGLTVMRELIARLPGYSMVYFGDTARTPYGNKSPEVVTAYGLEAAKFLVEKGAQIIVIACNTVSALGLEAIRKAYPDIPIFDVISPAVEEIKKGIINSKSHNKRRVGIMGTRGLVGSGVYQQLLETDVKFQVIAQPAPLLVPLVEEGWLDKPETKRIVRRYIQPFKQAQVDTLVLACTHYPLLKHLIVPRMGKRVLVVDPAEAAAVKVVDWAKEHYSQVEPGSGEYSFYASDYTEHTENIARSWLGRDLRLERVMN